MRLQDEQPSDRVQVGHGQNVLAAFATAFPGLLQGLVKKVYGLGRSVDQQRAAASQALPNASLAGTPDRMVAEMLMANVRQPFRDNQYDFMIGETKHNQALEAIARRNALAEAQIRHWQRVNHSYDEAR
jgi:hypothetical protein